MRVYTSSEAASHFRDKSLYTRTSTNTLLKNNLKKQRGEKMQNGCLRIKGRSGASKGCFVLGTD